MIYEDYMRNVLGNDYQQAQMSSWNSINNSYIYPQMQFENDSNIRKLYPDIYIVILPMIDTTLERYNTNNLDNDTLEKMTLDIYNALEVEEPSKTKSSENNLLKDNQNSGLNSHKLYTSNSNNAQNLNNKNNMQPQYQSKQVSSNITQANTINKKEEKAVEVAAPCPGCSNPLLRDLIKIMILNKLYGNRPILPPPMPPMSPNRPMPLPPPPQPRPPMYGPMPRIGGVQNRNSYFDMPYPEEA